MSTTERGQSLACLSVNLSAGGFAEIRLRSVILRSDFHFRSLSSKLSFKEQVIKFFIGVNPSRDPDSIAMADKDQQSWSGLSRYQDSEIPLPHQQHLREEYARVADVLVAKKVVLNHLMDVAGPKLPMALSPSKDPPVWSMTATLQDAVLQYGAWSDRQR
jgi:hypothetical protein